MHFKPGWCFLLFLGPAILPAAVVGTNPPSLPLTTVRVAELPADDQTAWREYLARSTALKAADQKFLADEIKAHGIKAPVPVSQDRTKPRLRGNRPASWYASMEARTMADNVVSFQTPAGGWSKNFNPADHRRQPGEAFSPDSNVSKFLTPGDHDTPRDLRWSYIGTFDNDATITELRFLAKVASAADESTGARWRAAVIRGLNYVFTAQYPNGGWPQVFPLDGGYHDAITFNDGAMANLLEFVRDAAAGRAEFAFLPADLRARAKVAEERGIACILACQLVVDGRRTVWCQQHDVLTLAPTSARNYEMPAQAGGESAGVAVYLMTIPNPTPEVRRAIHAAAAWFERTALHDFVFMHAPDGSGRKLMPKPGAGPLWARYYDVKTDRPIFGDRDKSIHDDISEISEERRNGYSWFNNGPQRALDSYARWSQQHPQ